MLPFSVWGLHFDEELVLELADHPTWRMLEVVRVDIGGEELWFSLDSHRCGRQWVAVDERSEAVARGFPAPTYRSDLRVQRTEGAREIRYEASWTMQSGEKIEVNARTRKPLWTPGLRNGNAMNHSQESALAVIDLEKLRPARGGVRIDGQEQRTVGLSRGLLVQAAAGVMADSRSLRAGADGSVVATRGGAEDVVYERVAAQGGFDLVARLPTGVETWRFVETGGGQHLQQVRLEQEGREVLRLRFNPPLPDIRRLQVTETTSRLVASVNGRPGVMSADVRVGPGAEANAIVIQLVPRAPRWAAARPVRTELKFIGDSAVQVDTVVEPTAPWAFGDLECP